MRAELARFEVERFVPEAASGFLIEAEHEARYRWAAAIARDREVLDAACGVGYGAAILAAAGARRVLGVDVSPRAIVDARQRAGEVAEFALADLRALRLPDSSFDLVCCFEAIEHLPDVAAGLDELCRVVRGDGVLLVSSPNRDVHPPGNPFHVHELVPAELERELRRRFAHVRMYRQRSHLLSLIEVAERVDATEERSAPALHDLHLPLPGCEPYSLAAASDAQLPELPPRAVAGGLGDVELLRAGARHLREHGDAPGAAMQVHRAQRERDRVRQRLARAKRARREAVRKLAAQERSLSWRLTRPLRAAGGALARWRSAGR